ncbi:MAG: SDR family NAD(P)-dependent oxidoreductase [Alphaproteobacteria bacterium]
MSFENPKSILITGASSGIGAALAEQYAEAGVTLFLGGRDPDRLDAIAQRCRTKGAAVLTQVCDVVDEAGMRAWIEASDDHQPLNLVIANAGIAGGTPHVSGLQEVALTVFEANVTGIFNTIHPALERMAKRPWPVSDAQIAIMSSMWGHLGSARSPAYVSSKAAVKAYGQSLRGAVRHMGIGVTVLCPGYVRSAMLNESMASVPFLIDADKAARIMRRALARNKARITFPWQVRWLAMIAINLPGWLVDRLNKPYGVPRLDDQ